MELDYITWLGHASFAVNAGSKTVYIDPFRATAFKRKADLILVTHPHFDHFSVDDIKAVSEKNTEVFIPHDSVKGVPEGNAKGVEPDKSYTSNGIRFRTVPAYNNEKERLQFHPKKNNWVGYMLEANGKRIYHPGDTDNIEEMASIDCDIALLPIGGVYTMDVYQAIEASKRISAGVFIPMHYKAVLGKEKAADAEKKFLKSVKNSTSLKEFGDAYYSF